MPARVSDVSEGHRCAHFRISARDVRDRTQAANRAVSSALSESTPVGGSRARERCGRVSARNQEVRVTEVSRLQASLAETWPDIDGLLGDRVQAFETALLPLLRALEQDPHDDGRLNAVYELLEAYPEIYERVVAATGRQTTSFRGAAIVQRPTVGRYVVVPIWYATDRKASGATAPATWFTGLQGPLTCGRVTVSIPDSHEKGRLEKPRLFRLEFREDPEKHVVLLSLTPADAAAWQADVTRALQTCTAQDILLFVHGYNVDFETAARRAAQFAYDLEFPGVCVLYSWPSDGTTLRYPADEDSAIYTVDHFEEVLTTLMTRLGANRVHAVAHSMGSRVLVEGLRRIDTSALPEGAASLREVIFAAPDINAETFRTFVTKFHGRAGRVTLYASDSDKALEASQTFHRYARAGDAGDGVLVTPGLETIDASAIDRTVLGHSYFCDNRVIIQDLFNLIIGGQGGATPRFGLRPRVTTDGTYWVMGL